MRSCEGKCIPEEEREPQPEGRGSWPPSWKWAQCKEGDGYFKVDGFCVEPDKCRGKNCPRTYACSH